MLEPKELGSDSAHCNVPKTVTVYRRAAGTDYLVPGVGCHPLNTMIFMPSKDGSLTQLAFSEACFDANRHGGSVLGKANFAELSVNVGVGEMVERPSDRQLVKVIGLCWFVGLPLTRPEKTTDSSAYGFLRADLYPPVPFKAGVWTFVEVEFEGKVKHFDGDVRVYPSSRTNLLSTGPYNTEYGETSDASINFRFRAEASDVLAEYGVIDHFSVILPNDDEHNDMLYQDE